MGYGKSHSSPPGASEPLLDGIDHDIHVGEGIGIDPQSVASSCALSGSCVAS